MQDDDTSYGQLWSEHQNASDQTNFNTATARFNDITDDMVSRGHSSKLSSSLLIDPMQSKSKNQKMIVLDGPAITCHQTVLSKPPGEMILTTPFGTFHRAPLGPWPTKQEVMQPSVNSDHEHSMVRARRKSFSGWLPHRRPTAKQQVRNGQHGIIRKPLNFAKSRDSVCIPFYYLYAFYFFTRVLTSTAFFLIHSMIIPSVIFII